MKENNINNVVKFKVDKDYRIFLPTFFDVNYQDKVVILAMKDHIEVWDFVTFYKYVDQLKMFGNVEHVTKYVYDNYISVSARRKICLTFDLASRYGVKNSVRIENCGDHICIFNNEDYECVQEVFQNDDNTQYLDTKKTVADNFNLSVNLWRNRIYVTTLLKKSNIHSDRVVLVPKKDFIEVHDYFEYIDLVEEARKKFEQEPDTKNKKYLDSLLFILKNRCCDILTNCKGNNYIYLPFPIIEYCNLKVDLKLEAHDGYFTIWDAYKFEVHKNNLINEEKNKLEYKQREKLLVRKIMERQAKKDISN